VNGIRVVELAARVEGARISGNPDVKVRGIAHDSREVKPGDLFACLVGGTFDGHRFAPEAVARGAAALLAGEDRAFPLPEGVPAILVSDTRRALPLLAAALYGNPSRDMKLVGVTGTNGKTTTTFLITSILRASGLRTGTIGTLGAELMGERLPSERTTPEADQLQELLAEMRTRGAQAIAMEVSSHALAQFRTDCCAFDAAAFTNLTQDHLDFHGTLDAYFETKLRLFREYPQQSGKPFAASVNLDDPRGEIVARETRGKALTYGLRSRADIIAEAVRTEPGRVAFRALTARGPFDVQLNIGGAFQVYNALAAIGVGLGLGFTPDVIAGGLAALKSVPGRFESIETGRPFHVIVDYAHTPDGMDNLLASARRLNPTRIILVFGCGGNRDRAKRPLMGRLAAMKSDVAVVTSDNPRHEEPQAIIADILPGMQDATARVIVEPDRRQAIAAALDEAREGDIVLIAGKGHEDYQEIAGVKHPFDDRKVVRELLKGVIG
jgi:UDP-N-acetylmuramoyl-L-alanyl-D-glutamate--2,6-diaminopimelate ligase